MNSQEERLRKRLKKKKRIRKKIVGTTERPRLTVFRSSKHIYAQIVDDTTGKTIASVSTMSKEMKGKVKNGGNVESAKLIGDLVAKAAQKAKVTSVSFDRNGYLYHGRVKALAEAAREAGLNL